MKKIIVLGIISIMSLSYISPSAAEDQKVIAIIDSAIDSSKVSNIIYEACFTIENTGPVINKGTGKTEYYAEGCPNGLTQQEGPKSASASAYNIPDIDHGYKVSQAAYLSSPNAKIIFIRIASIKKYPTFSMIRNDDKSLDLAIDWVANNAAKYSIDAVSISQARDNFTKGTCPKDDVLEKSVLSLSKIDVPVFAAVGNNGKTDHTSFPACSAGVYGVGSLKPNGDFTSYTHKGIGVDILGLGNLDILSYAGNKVTVTGTSITTPVVAATLVGKRNGETWSTVMSSLVKRNSYMLVGYSK